MKPQFKTMVLRSKTDRVGRTTVVASTPTPDRYNDVVAADWNLDHFRANPVVVWAHDYSLPPVGRVVDIEMDGGDLIASIEWDDSSSNPLGQTVASQFKRGFLNAVSVGFTPGEQVERSKLAKDDPNFSDKGFLYRNNELMEISAVPIPAHRDAVAIRQANMGAAMAGNVSRHIMDVEDNGDTWTITFAKHADEETPEAEAEPEEETRQADHDEDEEDQEMAAHEEEEEEEEEDEDEDDTVVAGKAFKSAVRGILLDLIGSNPAILERSTTPADGLNCLFGIDK